MLPIMEKQPGEIDRACLSLDSLSFTDGDISPPQLEDDEWDTDLETEGKTKNRKNTIMRLRHHTKWHIALCIKCCVHIHKQGYIQYVTLSMLSDLMKMQTILHTSKMNAFSPNQKSKRAERTCQSKNYTWKHANWSMLFLSPTSCATWGQIN